MIIVIILLFAQISAEKVGRLYSQRIVGGTQTVIHRFPFMVTLIMTKRANTVKDCICGGTILNSGWVLTAGHCFVTQAKDGSYRKIKTKTLSVLAGSTRCFDLKEEGYQIIPIRYFFLQKEYNVVDGSDRTATFNDIALVELKNKLRFGDDVAPIKIATKIILKGQTPFKRFPKACLAMGWGYLEETGKHQSPELHYVDLDLISQEECKEKYENLVLWKFSFDINKTICTLDKMGRKDTCVGDSGGPLVCDGYQVGIVSAGFGCARGYAPNIWMRVDEYVNWIQETILMELKNSKHSSGKLNDQAVMLTFFTFSVMYLEQ